MVILVYGEDMLRVKEKREELMGAFKTKHDPSGINAERFAFPEQQDAFLQAIGAMPFMAKRRMCVAEGLAETITKKDDAATWTKRLAGRGDETIIVLVDGGLTIEQSRKNNLYTALREAEKVAARMRAQPAEASTQSAPPPDDESLAHRTRSRFDLERLHVKVRGKEKASG